MADRCFKHRARACKKCQGHKHEYYGFATSFGGPVDYWYCGCGSSLDFEPPKEILHEHSA
jgi:hypothetical protein